MAEVTSIYGGRATITFVTRGKSHYYVVAVPGIIDKLFQPSVTAIIGMKDKSQALIGWAVKCMGARIRELLAGSGDELNKQAFLALVDGAQDTWRDVKQDSADVGSIAHRVLHQYLLDRKPPETVKVNPILAPDLTQDIVDLANNSIDAGVKFIDGHNIQVIQAEAPRWSPTYGFLGTGDLVATIDGTPSFLDWKSGKRIYAEVFLQLAAYAAAYEEEFPEAAKIQNRWAVNIGRDGKLSSEVRSRDSMRADFKAFLGLLEAWRWNEENTPKWDYQTRGYSIKPAPVVLGPLDKIVPKNEVK